MKPVSQDFIDAWKAKHGKGGVLYVQYKRRYWNGSAYVYEGSWNQYTMRDFVEVGNITFKLDTPLLNEVKTSSLILKFKNSDYQMLPSNTGGGLFAADAVATTGYHPFLTQFRVLFGYVLADGSIETTELFTGVAIDYLFNARGGYVEVTVSGNEYLLQSSDAMQVADAISGGATTNTSGNDWTTVLTGIATLPTVYDNGVEQIQGTDYTISGTGVYGQGAVISFTHLASGPVTYDGSAFKTLQKVEDLVELLAIQANISSYNINPVIFPGGSGATETEIGNFVGTAVSPTWTLVETTGGTFTGLDGKITLRAALSTTGERAATPSTPAYGIWTFPIDSIEISNTGSFVYIFFIASNDTGSAVNPSTDGYVLIIGRQSSPPQHLVCGLYRWHNSTFAAAIFADVEAPPTLSGTYLTAHDWTITRGSNGLFQVFADGILIGSGTDNTYTTSTHFAVMSGQSGISLYNSIVIGPIVNQTAVVLTMANFTGMTCYEAVQKLAKLADYEWGFDSTGTMFFRSKTPASLTPIVSISQADGISEVLEFRPGYGDVINTAKVTNETYFREYNSDTLPESSPKSSETFLIQILTEDYTDFLLAYDPIIAAGRAQNIHDANYRPRRRARIKSKIIPFAELSDVLEWSFFNNPRMADNIFGDPLETWGASAFGVPTNVLARELPGKSISIVMNPNDCTGEYELQEVLS